MNACTIVDIDNSVGSTNAVIFYNTLIFKNVGTEKNGSIPVPLTLRLFTDAVNCFTAFADFCLSF